MQFQDWALLFRQQARKKGIIRGFIRSFRKDLQRFESRKILSRYLFASAEGIEIGAGEQTFAPARQTLFSDGFQSHAGHPTLATEFFPAEKIPYPDQTFDYLISEHVLEHVQDPIGVLGEWARVLKPTGFMCITLPAPDRTFDRYRLSTTLNHLIQDHQDGGRSSEDEHWKEWKENVLDKGLAKHYQGIQKEQALQKNELHRHVWRLEDFVDLLKYLQFEVLESVPQLKDREDSYLVIAKRKT